MGVLTGALLLSVLSIITSVVFTADVFAQNATEGVLTATNDPDIVLLSQRYNHDRFSDEIVGEVLNNNTRTFDKYEVDIHALFYDSSGALVGSEQGFIDAESLSEGDKSAFSVFILDDAIRSEAVTYDLIINDERVLEGASIGGEDASSSDGDNN